MKDIDFDELDKAVNSLMGSVTNTPSKQSSEQSNQTPPTQTPPVSEPASAPVRPEPPAVRSLPEVQAVPQAAPVRAVSQAVRKSSGRFMDVVHPSSDMRSASPVKTPARSSGITPPARPSMPVPSVKQPQMPSTTVAPDPVTSKPSREVSFPDPLDMMPQGEVDKEPIATVVEEESTAVVSDAELTKDLSQTPKDATSESSEPLESLFLPNVKVEKRPLNIAGNTDTITDETEPDTGQSAEREDVDKKNTDTLVTPDPTLAELGEDVLAIESDSSAAATENDQNEEEATQPVESPVPATTSSSSSVVSSIPRQYSVQPSSDTKHHEALYDTAAQAGAPLTHPAKGKSGWMVVLWVVLLIVIGVGGALALYFLKVF